MSKTKKVVHSDNVSADQSSAFNLMDVLNNYRVVEYLDVAIKLASVLSLLGILWGGYLLYVYLASQHLIFKYTASISSINIIITLAIFGLFVSLLFIIGLFIFPYLYRTLKLEYYAIGCNKNNNGIGKDYVVSLLALLSIFITIELNQHPLYVIPIISTLLSCLVMKNSGFDYSKYKKFDHIKYALIITFVILLFFCPLLFLVIISNMISKKMGFEFVGGLLLLGGFILVYSYVSTLIINKSVNNRNIFFCIFVTIFLISVYFPVEFSRLLIKVAGVGQFSSDIYVNQNADKMISWKTSFKSNRKVNDEVFCYKKIFVVADMAGYLAVRSSEVAKQMIVIDKKDINGMENEEVKDAHNK